MNSLEQGELFPRLRIEELPEGFGYWFSGLVDGEGFFLIYANERERGKYFTREADVRFGINLRDDDAHVLQYVQQVLHCGTLSYEDTACNPRLSFGITRAKDLLFVIVPLFRRFPLHTKKAREFELWAEAVQIRYNSVMYRSTPGRSRTGHFLSDAQWNRFKELERETRYGIKAYQGRSEYTSW